MMMRWCTVLHLLAWLESAFALFTYHYYVLTQMKQSYGRQWKFLTYLNMQIQLVLFSLCVMKDVLSWMQFDGLASRLKKIRDTLYASVAAPICLTVFISFWAIFVFDRELIHPKHLDEILPRWTNHMWHSAILITLLEPSVDHLTYPKWSHGLSICLSCGLAYLGWILWIHHVSGFWVYPILGVLNGVSFVVFIIIEMICSLLFYEFGAGLNNFMKPKVIRQPKKLS